MVQNPIGATCLCIVKRRDKFLALVLANAAVQADMRIAALLAKLHEQIQRLRDDNNARSPRLALDR